MTETQENPLVAKSESPTGLTTNMGSSKNELDNVNAQTSGAGIFNDAASTLTDFRNGDWVNAGVDVVTDGLDLLGAAMDPLGTLASAGVGWLIEHISFLKEGLDKLAGDPEAVTAKAVTWTNISKQLSTTAEDYEAKAKKLGQSFANCGAADAYQATASSYADLLRGASGQAKGASTAMNVAAAMVGTERGLIRDMISSFVGELIVKGLAALAASWCTFGGTIAAFIADTVVEGGILAEKIGSKISKLLEQLGKLAEKVGMSKGAFEKAAEGVTKAMGKVADKSVDTAINIEKKANDLKHTGAAWDKLSDAEKAEKIEKKADGWKESAQVPLPGKVKGWAEDYSEDGRSFLKPSAWQKADGDVPKWNTADTVGVATEGRRQENEQIDRYKEGTEAYKKEHESEGGSSEGGSGE